MNTPRTRQAANHGGAASAAALRLILVTGDARTRSALESLLSLDDRFRLEVAADLSGGDHRLAPGRYDVALVDEPLSHGTAFERLLAGAARLGGLPVIVLSHAGSRTRTDETPTVEHLVIDDLTPAVLKQALRAAAEQHRIRTLAHLAAIVESSSDAIFSRTLDGEITSWNSGAERMFGYSASEAVGANVISLVPAETARLVPAILEETRAGRSVRQFEIECLRKHGTRFPVLLTVSPMRDASGHIFGAATVVHDITERRNAQAALIESEAGARLYAGEIQRHVGFAELTMEQLAPGDPKREDIQRILNAAQSAASLTGQLLAFSRKQILATAHLDLNGVVEGTQALLRRLIGEDVTLVTNLHADRCPISADRGQIEQVIMNLAVNARDAMPDGGTLTIATGVIEHDDAFVAAHAGAVRGRHVTLTISDTGTGMQPAVLARIFEPFFTTKEQGRARVWGSRLSTASSSRAAAISAWRARRERARHSSSACRTRTAVRSRNPRRRAQPRRSEAAKPCCSSRTSRRCATSCAGPSKPAATACSKRTAARPRWT